MINSLRETDPIAYWSKLWRFTIRGRLGTLHGAYQDGQIVEYRFPTMERALEKLDYLTRETGRCDLYVVEDEYRSV